MCGMFALIVFPFGCESTEIKESHKYQFNSIKFVEKQILNK